ncbi:MAG: ComEC/Rec2 family competence protein, partial [Clostridia bacterium]
ANLMTYPLSAYCFGKIPLLFLLANIILLPYTMFIYLFLLIITLFALATTLSGAVTVMNVLVFPFKAGVNLIGNLPFATLPVGIGILGIICCAFCLFMLSRFIFLTKRERVICVCSTCSIFGVASSILALVQVL